MAGKPTHSHIINIDSIAGRQPWPNAAAYAATKWALSGFSLSIFEVDSVPLMLANFSTRMLLACLCMLLCCHHQQGHSCMLFSGLGRLLLDVALSLEVQELKDKNINVTCVYPGWVATDMTS